MTNPIKDPARAPCMKAFASVAQRPSGSGMGDLHGTKAESEGAEVSTTGRDGVNAAVLPLPVRCTNAWSRRVDGGLGRLAHAASPLVDAPVGRIP